MGGGLYSERHGRERRLSLKDLATLIWKQLARLRHAGYFDEALRGDPGAFVPDPRIADAEAFFVRRLKVSGIADYLLERNHPPFECSHDPDVLFDLLELLHAECVSQPSGSHPQRTYDKAAGQRELRDAVNAELSLSEPPLELLESGAMVERAPDALRPLLDEVDVEQAGKAIGDPLNAAIAQFRRRTATTQERRAAVKHLADVLENLRDEIDETMLSKDEADLFQIANRFGIRHWRDDQQRLYDHDVWYEWMFFVYLATAKAVVAVSDRQATQLERDAAEAAEEGRLDF